MTRLTFERASQLLEYNPDTGLFIWKQDRTPAAKSGDPAGRIDKTSGYGRIGIDGRLYASHRVAWLLYYGSFPKSGIDHIDGDKANNRITNLRDIPQSANLQNIHCRRGRYLQGVTAAKNGKFRAGIKVDKKCLHIGTFLTQEEAHAAYINAKRALHPYSTI